MHDGFVDDDVPGAFLLAIVVGVAVLRWGFGWFAAEDGVEIVGFRCRCGFGSAVFGHVAWLEGRVVDLRVPVAALPFVIGLWRGSDFRG